MSEWRELSLGEIVNFRRGHDLPKTKMVNEEVPVVGSNGIIGYHNKVTTKAPCVTIGRSGNVGKPLLTNTDCWAHNTTLYIDNFRGNNPYFIYYFLKTLNLENYRGGSAVPTLNRNHIHPIKTQIPPLPEQKAIAHILGKLDDKIELNRQMNQTLEEMAQALFKSWFVDFDPVFDNLPAGQAGALPDVLRTKYEKRKLVPDEKKLIHSNPELAEGFPSSFVFNETLDKWIPEGWEVKKLGDVAMPQKGKNITKKDAIPGIFPVVAGGLNPSTYHNQSNTNAPVITISASGANAGYVNLYHNAVWSSDSSFIDNTITDHVYTIYLFLKKNQKPLFEMQEGSAQPHIYPSHISSLEFFVSNKAITEQFEKIVENNFLKIKSSILETETLTQLRDTLLPQLISGKVRVPVG